MNYLRNYLQLSETYLFVIVYHELATEDANFRWSACELGAHMVTYDYVSLTTALSRALSTKTGHKSSQISPISVMSKIISIELGFK